VVAVVSLAPVSVAGRAVSQDQGRQDDESFLRHAAVFLVLIVLVLVSAEVSRVEVALRRDVAGGRLDRGVPTNGLPENSIFRSIRPTGAIRSSRICWQLLVSGEHQNERLRVIIS
jgi:hypothetical protein